MSLNTFLSIKAHFKKLTSPLMLLDPRTDVGLRNFSVKTPTTSLLCLFDGGGVDVHASECEMDQSHMYSTSC
jgi:hypothetical protein